MIWYASRTAVPAVLGQRGRGQRGERNALVGRPEQHVELDAGVGDRSRVVATEPRCGIPRVKQTGVEKVGADTARLQRELTEAQHAEFERELNKFTFVGLHDSWLSV
jgi:hypothetical protein